MFVTSNERGATMVETIMVLGILGAMAVGAAALANSMFDKYRMSRVGQQIDEVRKVISARYVADGNYSSLSVENMIKENIAPRDMVEGTTKLNHSFKGAVRAIGSVNTYEINFMSLPLKACLELGIMNWTIDNTSDLVSMKINNDTYKWPWVSASGKSLPATVLDVSRSCKAGSTNNIIWVFQ